MQRVQTRYPVVGAKIRLPLRRTHLSSSCDIAVPPVRLVAEGRPEFCFLREGDENRTVRSLENKNAARCCSRCTALTDGLDNVVKAACPATGDYRHVHSRGNLFDQGDIVPLEGTITVY